MTTRALFAPLLVSLIAFSVVTPALADVAPKPDDIVAYEISAEDWTVTKTAHVTLNVEAAVTAANEGTMRADMTKAVNDAAKSDWRLTGFNRSQDQTGMERWSVVFDTRLPEAALNGMPDAVKKASKAGMQITIGSVDFAPTLDETEATRAGLRTHIYKEANEQLALLNSELPGRSYRIAQITFNEEMGRPMAKPMLMMARAPVASADSSDMAEPDHAQKVVMHAHIMFAALAPAAAAH